jgi:hypothetical protein
MLYSALTCVLVVVSATAYADEPQAQIRPITKAEAVLAVYCEGCGRGSDGTPAIIFAAWPDGRIVWSGDGLHGGAPYRTGNIDPQKVATLLKRFEKDGLFAIEKLNRANFGPDSQFTTVFVKSGTKQVAMQSWHELFESADKLVVTSAGASVLEDAQRLEVLSKEPNDYLFFRFVWSETRSKLMELIPKDSSASPGKPLMAAGVLSWQEPPSKP